MNLQCFAQTIDIVNFFHIGKLQIFKDKNISWFFCYKWYIQETQNSHTVHCAELH